MLSTEGMNTRGHQRKYRFVGRTTSRSGPARLGHSGGNSLEFYGTPFVITPYRYHKIDRPASPASAARRILQCIPIDALTLPDAATACGRRELRQHAFDDGLDERLRQHLIDEDEGGVCFIDLMSGSLLRRGVPTEPRPTRSFDKCIRGRDDLPLSP
jgi:hypothetical protein